MLVLLEKLRRIPTITLVISSWLLAGTLVKFKLTVVGEAGLPPAAIVVAEEL